MICRREPAWPGLDAGVVVGGWSYPDPQANMLAASTDRQTGSRRLNADDEAADRNPAESLLLFLYADPPIPLASDSHWSAW
jgi:hypothetical protein